MAPKIIVTVQALDWNGRIFEQWVHVDYGNSQIDRGLLPETVRRMLFAADEAEPAPARVVPEGT